MDARPRNHPWPTVAAFVDAAHFAGMSASCLTPGEANAQWPSLLTPTLVGEGPSGVAKTYAFALPPAGGAGGRRVVSASPSYGDALGKYGHIGLGRIVRPSRLAHYSAR